MAAEMTTDDKILALAKLSRQYQAGVRDLVESGEVDADDLDALVEDAEVELDAAVEVQTKRRKVRKLARTF